MARRDGGWAGRRYHGPESGSRWLESMVYGGLSCLGSVREALTLGAVCAVVVRLSDTRFTTGDGVKP